MDAFDPMTFPSFEEWMATNKMWTAERVADYDSALFLLQLTSYQYERLAHFHRHLLEAASKFPELKKAAMLGTALQYWDDIQRSRKTLTSAVRGHESVHGTTEEKAERWKDQQDEVDRIRAKHPDWSWEDVKRLAAKNCGVSPTTIKRHCVDPKKS